MYVGTVGASHSFGFLLHSIRPVEKYVSRHLLLTLVLTLVLKLN